MKKIIIALIITGTFLVNHAIAKSRLVYKQNLKYLGSFRVPKEKLCTSKYCTLENGSVLLFNPQKNSLFIFTKHHERLVEISIPKLMKSNDVNELFTAEVIQEPVDITNGHWNNLTKDGGVLQGTDARAGGLLLFDGKLIGSAYAYYDANWTAFRSHYVASRNWTKEGTNFHGMFEVGISPFGPSIANGGFVGGYMALIPPEWRSRLGGPALTGQAGLAVIGRSSFGPCVWEFNPDDLGVINPTPANMLLGYTKDHMTLGTHHGPSPYFNGTSAISGLVFPFGTDSLLFFGRYGYGKNGDGEICYGIGTSDPALHKTPVPGTNGKVIYCYDPTSTDKGTHGYPYVYRVWAYDANDLLKVKKGEINPKTGRPYKPWDLTPYSMWDFSFPFTAEAIYLSGVTYDPSTQRIFIAQGSGDVVGYGHYPLIHVFKVVLSSNSTADTTPPGDVSNIKFTIDNKTLSFNWNNPSDSDYAGVKVVYTDDGTEPLLNDDGSIKNGKQFCVAYSPSTTCSKKLENLFSNKYNFGFFTFDSNGNYSHTQHVVIPKITIQKNDPGADTFKVDFSVDIEPECLGTLSYKWDFDDGSNIETTSSASISHDFIPPKGEKVYNVKLIITNASGCQVTRTIPVTITNPKPSAPVNIKKTVVNSK